jgi:hypothetical protein
MQVLPRVKLSVRVPWVGALVATVLLGGCGKGDPLNKQAVSGTVTLKGEPLDQGAIQFAPADSGTKHTGGATIENGRFSAPAARGLPPGNYTVRISSAGHVARPAEEAPGDSQNAAPERIPAEWNTDSKQQIKVEDGGKNHFEFNIP